VLCASSISSLENQLKALQLENEMKEKERRLVELAPVRSYQCGLICSWTIVFSFSSCSWQTNPGLKKSLALEGMLLLKLTEPLQGEAKVTHDIKFWEHLYDQHRSMWKKVLAHSRAPPITVQVKNDFKLQECFDQWQSQELEIGKCLFAPLTTDVGITREEQNKRKQGRKKEMKIRALFAEKWEIKYDSKSLRIPGKIASYWLS
jgi:hypothetical protein